MQKTTLISTILFMTIITILLLGQTIFGQVSQDFKVTGHIFDEANRPLIYVNVFFSDGFEGGLFKLCTSANCPTSTTKVKIAKPALISLFMFITMHLQNWSPVYKPIFYHFLSIPTCWIVYPVMAHPSLESVSPI